VVYSDLHRVAQHHMAKERPDHTLQATALVHEACVRLLDAERQAGKTGPTSLRCARARRGAFWWTGRVRARRPSAAATSRHCNSRKRWQAWEIRARTWSPWMMH